VIRTAVITAVLLAPAVPAVAQTTSLPATGSGGVGSASLRNGFPAAAGAVVLPNLGNPTNPAVGAVATGTPTTGAIGGGGGGGGSGRGATPGNSGTGTGSSARRASGSGGNFVLCEPAGASGEAAFLVGTDLACAPQ